MRIRNVCVNGKQEGREFLKLKMEKWCRIYHDFSSVDAETLNFNLSASSRTTKVFNKPEIIFKSNIDKLSHTFGYQTTHEIAKLPPIKKGAQQQQILFFAYF